MTLDTVDDLLAVVASGAALDDGEAVDLLAHSLQCACLVAAERPDDPELQVAALVHDIGSVLAPAAPATHARTGADAVRELLGPRVASLVEGHDQAKRYLVTVDTEYRSRLSATSIETLVHQGGPMTADDVARFEAAPHHDALVALRRADDAAKMLRVDAGSLAAWDDVVRAVAGS